jgi:hypothetical protein
MLWHREDLATLRSFASGPGYADRSLPDGTQAEVERWTVRFPPAEPNRLPNDVLKRTYTVKPLIAPFGRGLFGELAILQCLERDGWSGVWVDTYHGSELFWRGMPHESSRVDLSTEPKALELYRDIIAEHGKRGGFFDVFAWQDSDFLFIEYKGEGDTPNANESSWIAAALRYGIKSAQLLFAEYASAAA